MQKHLNYKQIVNSGSYYTPDRYIKICCQFLKNNIQKLDEYYILDSSCGYGNFFNKNIFDHKKFIGADIDEKAIHIAKKTHNNIQYFVTNSLLNITREKYLLTKNNKLIIIGNPPYNDMTSILKNKLKNNHIKIDKDIKTRDLGISFLKSYAKLNADYICILHPLSYLIKESNFKLLKEMFNRYKLKQSILFNSVEFDQTSKMTGFPIIIAFYQRNDAGMNYDFIKNYSFQTIEGKKFKINDYDYIDNYVSKYPSKNKSATDENTIAYFWTMRDINALKRSRTFIETKNYNAIDVTYKNIDYYCYVDIFKKYISYIPYYFGNNNIMINNLDYLKIKNDIIKYSIISHTVLKKVKNRFNLDSYSMNLNKIDNYFKNLLGEHYVN